MSCLTEHLLELVYTYPILYDLSHKDYKNMKKKDKIWDDIGRDMNTSGDTLKKKWKNLRDTYAKYLKTTKPTTVQGKKNYKSWQWATQMERYKQFLTMAQTTSNVHQSSGLQPGTVENAEEGAEEDGQLFHDNATELLDIDLLENDALRESGNIQLRNSPGTSQQSAKQKSAKRQKLNPTISNTDKVVQYLENSKRRDQLDAIDHLMLGYAKTIKNFSPQRQAQTKIEFAQIIFRKELEQIEENESR